MKNNLIHELIGRVYETKFKNNFKEELMKGSFFKTMDERILEEIIKLDNYDFNYYLSFLYKIYLKNNNNLNIYQTKLIKITSLLIPKLGTLNANSLVDILINTSLIDYKDIVKFTRIFLNIKETKSIDMIVDIIYNEEIKDRSFNLLFDAISNSQSNTELDFVIGLLDNKKLINNEMEIKKALEFLNKTKYEDKLVAFYKIFIVGGLKDISLYSEYALTIEEALLKVNNYSQLETIIKLSLVLKNSRFKNSIIKKVLNTDNRYALNEYIEISKIPNILNDNNIIEIINKLDNLKNESQGIIIDKLLEINPSNILLLIDEVLKYDNINLLYINNYLDKIKKDNLSLLNDIELFRIVLDINKSYKYDFLMKVLEYKDLLLSKKNREIIKNFFNVKENYKYFAFNEYLKDNINNKEFRLDSDYSNNIIMLLKGTNKDFQANTLIRVSKVVKDNKYKYKDNLLIKAAYVKYEAVGILLGDLLETNIINDSRFLDILHNFETCDNLCGQIGMVELAKNMKLRNSEFLTGYFMIMKRLKKINQVGVLLRILDNYPDLNEYQLFKYCEKIMFVTNTKLLLMLEKLIMNNKKLDKKTLDVCILEIDKNSTYDNIKFIEQYLKDNGMEDSLEEFKIDIEEGIEMLNRQKALDLNPNSILTYRKIRSSK